MPASPTAASQAIRLRKWLKRITWTMGILLLISIAADHLRASSYSNDYRFDARSFTVHSVESEDQITIETSPGKLLTVHLIGVAPLDSRPTSSEAKQLAGKTVTLKLDATQTRDAQGRLL